jgi:hypothetical protein
MTVAYGIGIKIESLPDRPDPTYSIDQIVAGEIGESTCSVTQVDEKDVSAAVNGLLEILVVKNIIDVSVANSILATWKISGKGRFDANAYALTVSSVLTIRINANDQCKQRFTASLSALINSPSSMKLISSLLTILMDSGTINMQTAYNIMTTFRIAGQLQFKPTPKVTEPKLVGGTDPGQNMIIDSTVTINQVVSDVKPLIKRLTLLVVGAPLCTQTVANHILTTFNIQTGGTVLTSATISQYLKFSGKATASQKFIKNLTPLLYNPAGNLNGLVKIITELLLDNAVIEYQSTVKFLVAYGVGNHINVDFKPINNGNGNRFE